MDDQWTAAQLPELTGKTAVVTGATGGIGGPVARELARAGALVVVAARDETRGEAAASAIRAAVRGASVEVARLDLARLESVRAFARDLAGAHPGPDILVDCAGVMAVPHQRTEDGFELQFGVNHLGHFALTGLLLPGMKDREGARVVVVSSLNHRWGEIAWDDPQQELGYRAWRGYNQSKLANLLFAFELDRRLRAAHAAARCVAAHPGYTATPLQGRVGGPVVRAALHVSNRLFGQTPDMGALPVLYAAAAPDVPGGTYVGPARFSETRGHPAVAQASAAARDPALAARLWALSERLTGVRYDL
jgi:NAD(P)-dependent dehydrogenase (short-subunit alcohol dehydrogenase family)